MPRLIRGAAALALAVGLGATAFAHVTLDPPHAAADSYFKVDIRVPHGCEGSPMLRLRVRIPDGVFGVKPQPKPGWEISIVKEKLAQPVTEGHGRVITERVSEVVWSGGKLLDAHYDEFGIHMKLPDKPNTVLYFPAIQECEKGVHRWIEIPEPGKSARDYKEPAPALRLGPKATAH
ncbi:MAG: YcnI family protein [Alphaproteobacteria bacterium]